jgi:PAS domain S-box-containing protein
MADICNTSVVRLHPLLSRAPVCHPGEIVLLADETGQILDASDSAAAAYGHDRRNLLGMNVRSLYAPGALPATAIRCQTHESLHVRADSSQFPVEIRTTGIEAGGKTFWLSTVRDISDRKMAEDVQQASGETIDRANRLLQQLSKDLLRSQDYEKRRIARELHDSTAQLLAALSINLGLLRDSNLDAPQRSKLLSVTIDLAGQCSEEVRTLSYLLHPPLLDDLGLRGALQTFAQGFHQRTGSELELKIPPDFGRLDRGLEMTIFRIVQEGLANIQRHSGSAPVEIRLERDLREVRLEVLDHDRGLPEASLPNKKESFRLGVGILGMRQRAEQLGGVLKIASTGDGTRLTVTLPLPDSQG